MPRRPGKELSTMRFGIGEWFGRSFVQLTARERRQYALVALQGKHKDMPCPAHPSCTKSGGVCSIRLYHQDPETGLTAPVAGPEGLLRTVCPRRFEEAGLIYRWVGQHILGDEDSRVLSEIRFLERPQGQRMHQQEEESDEATQVGRIDRVLVSASRSTERNLVWCALEVQAVYFSGTRMSVEWQAIANDRASHLPFPVGRRRPDYRSSGPKRLMPQLQIKVPTLRRWGKRLAVVVDQDFFSWLAPMQRVADLSNADIAWFIVRYEEGPDRIRLRRGQVFYTTLEGAVEGLTAGIAVSLETFEQRIRERLQQGTAASPDAGQ